MGAKMTITGNLKKKLDQARMKLAMEKAVTKTMNDLRDNCVIEAPIKTGNLRRSHSVDVLIGGEIIEGVIKNSANYWQYVNFGTSRQDANNFVGRAIQNVKPDTKIKEYFHQLYNGG